MRLLALDLGAKRIGLALSDPVTQIAFPAGALTRRGREQDLAALCELIREKEVDGVVVGLPLHMNGRAGPEAEMARRFARALSTATGLRVEMQDERLTSIEAERSLREVGGKASRKSGQVDAAAAAIILRTYLLRVQATTAEVRD